MSRICTICSHAEHKRIDALLVEAVSNRRIAAQFDVSESAVRRHGASHLPKIEVKAATEERALDHFQKLARLERVLYSVLSSRLKDEDHSAVLRVHQSLLKNMEFEIKLGEVEDLRRELEDLRREIDRREIDR